MRPKGFVNPYRMGMTSIDQAREDAFEAGADAILTAIANYQRCIEQVRLEAYEQGKRDMLEGLKKEGEYRKAYDLFHDIPHIAGTYVFIPD